MHLTVKPHFTQLNNVKNSALAVFGRRCSVSWWKKRFAYILFTWFRDLKPHSVFTNHPTENLCEAIFFVNTEKVKKTPFIILIQEMSAWNEERDLSQEIVAHGRPKFRVDGKRAFFFTKDFYSVVQSPNTLRNPAKCKITGTHILIQFRDRSEVLLQLKSSLNFKAVFLTIAHSWIPSSVDHFLITLRA